MLRHFKHENVIGLRDLIPPPDDEPFVDIYIVLDFMETDLHKIIYSKNELTDEHIQYFLYQILKGMKYIHSSNGQTHTTCNATAGSSTQQLGLSSDLTLLSFLLSLFQ